MGRFLPFFQLASIAFYVWLSFTTIRRYKAIEALKRTMMVEFTALVNEAADRACPMCYGLAHGGICHDEDGGLVTCGPEEDGYHAINAQGIDGRTQCFGAPLRDLSNALMKDVMEESSAKRWWKANFPVSKDAGTGRLHRP